MPHVNSCSVFVSSSDAYSDIWPAFFQIFRREWPDYKGTIYLNTEHKVFSYEGLNIVCTQVGKQSHFGETLHAGLRMVDGDVVLFFMIDYFIERKVDVAFLNQCYEEFLKQGPSTLFLCDIDFPKIEPVKELKNCYRFVPSGRFNFSSESGWFSFQAAFWRIADMLRLVAQWEDPWHAEFYGFLRSKIFRPEVWYMQKSPVVYDKSGVLHNRGRWHRNALDRIDFSGIDIDFSKREDCVPLRFANLRIVLYDIFPCWSNVKSLAAVLWLCIARFSRGCGRMEMMATHAKEDIKQ